MITFLVGLIVQFVYNSDYATYAIQMLVGINIFHARKKHRFLGFLVAIIPLVGIANGFLIPIMFLPYAAGISEKATLIYQYVSFGALLFLAAIFYVKENHGESGLTKICSIGVWVKQSNVCFGQSVS